MATRHWSRYLKIIPVLLLSVSLLSQTAPTSAESLTALQREKQRLAEQAEAARKAAQAKAEQAAQIQNQIVTVASRISQTEAVLNSTISNIETANKNIADLEAKIKVEENNLALEKEKMARVVTAWYMEGQGGLLEAVVGADTISAAVDSQEYYDSIKRQIEEIQAGIAKAKDELSNQKSDKEKQLLSLQGMKSDQETAKRSLENDKAYKDRLLKNTNSAITELKSTEQAAQQRMVEIDAKIRALTATRTWGDQILSSNDQTWYYMQTGNTTRLGSSPYTISQYGCLITSMAMVSTYFGHRVTPDAIAQNNGIFDREGYLLVSSPSILGVTILPSQSINWHVVEDELANGRPVIVSIYLPSVGAINRDGSSHFIVIKGKSGSKYLMHDPIGDGRGYNMSQVRSMKLVVPK